MAALRSGLHLALGDHHCCCPDESPEIWRNVALMWLALAETGLNRTGHPRCSAAAPGGCQVGDYGSVGHGAWLVECALHHYEVCLTTARGEV